MNLFRFEQDASDEAKARMFRYFTAMKIPFDDGGQLPSPPRKTTLRNAQIANMLRKLDNDDEADFQVLATSPNPPSSEQPLFVIVHPGDALQNPFAWGESKEYLTDVLPYSMKSQAGMAEEGLARILAGDDVVLLHRGSCSQFSEKRSNHWIDKNFARMISLARTQGAVLFGDDLQAVYVWLMQSYELSTRPHILLTGAYADAENGCVTALGTFMEAVVMRGRLAVSPHAMSGNVPSDSQAWIPGGV